MEQYQHILVAVDFSEHEQRVVERSLALKELSGAQLTLVHVIDYIPVSGSEFGEMMPLNFDLSEELRKSARKKMARLLDQYSIPQADTHLLTGSVRTEVIDLATRLKVDLMVVGSHGWGGIDLLLGSTTDTLLHHAPCDVVVVRCLES